MKNIKHSLNQDPLEVLDKALNNVKPLVEVISKRVGGAIYQVPIEISLERGITLGLRFIVKSARNRPGKTMSIKLQNEIIDAFNNIGNSVKKKEEMHKMAESNKAFTTIKFY